VREILPVQYLRGVCDKYKAAFLSRYLSLTRYSHTSRLNAAAAAVIQDLSAGVASELVRFRLSVCPSVCLSRAVHLNATASQQANTRRIQSRRHHNHNVLVLSLPTATKFSTAYFIYREHYNKEVTGCRALEQLRTLSVQSTLR